MATSTIAQTFDSVKTLSEKTEQKKQQYLEGFSQADYDPTRYDMSGQLRSKLEEIIMAGTNAQAFSILSAVDVIDHIPGAGENFVPLNGFANFYGVSEEYLKGVLNRHKFLQKNYPDDVKRVYAADIVKDDGIPLVRDAYCKVPGRDDLSRYRLLDAYGAPCVSLPKKNSFFIYSPRVVLATALSLLYTDKSDENCTAKKVALAIKRSDYRVIPQEQEPSEEPHIPRNTLPLLGNGRIELTMDLLDYIIRKTSSEMISNLLQSFNVSGEKQTSAPSVINKVEKPKDWDDILAKWKYGKLTTHKAAKMTGMSVTSFQDYASGKKTFD